MSGELPRLIVITDWTIGERELLRAVDEIGAELGARVAFQHRHPGASGREFLREARLLAELCARHRSPLFVNGRLDVALLVGSHVHLPASGPDVEDVRFPLPSGEGQGEGAVPGVSAPARTLVSIAVHDAREAERARAADLALLSPVFGAGSKPDDTRTPLGLDGFEALARAVPCPAFALGGVTPENAASLRDHGAYGAAAISAVLRARDPADAARTIVRAFGG